MARVKAGLAELRRQAEAERRRIEAAKKNARAERRRIEAARRAEAERALEEVLARRHDSSRRSGSHCSMPDERITSRKSRPRSIETGYVRRVRQPG